MKRRFSILMAVGLASVGGLFPAVAMPFNASFEDGGFAGWQIQMPDGRAKSQLRHQAAGTNTVGSSWSAPTGFSAPLPAMAGDAFAVLGSLAKGNFAGNRKYHLSLNQKLTLGAGETLSGWAAFYNGDYTPQDAAWVKVWDDAGRLVATPWQKYSGATYDADLAAAPYLETTPWTLWAWQAPDSGQYTLSLGLTTGADNNHASYGFFDEIFVIPAISPVPEPSTLTLIGLGALALTRIRRKQNEPLPILPK